MPTPTNSPARKKTAAAARPSRARAPQDRKPKAAVKSLPEQTPGWELLKPFADIPIWDQTDLYESLMDIMNDYETGAVSEVKFVGEVSKSLVQFAVDEEAFLKFVSGPHALVNASPLVLAWVEQMGKTAPSGS